jgi:tetratricopeptide (TPR) repeat protein
MRFVRLLLVLLAFTVSVAAQSSGRSSGSSTTTTTTSSQGNIRGKVVLQNGAPISQAVRINLLNLRGTRDMLFTDNQGQFEFRALPTGDYTIEAEGDKLKFDVSTESVHVFGSNATAVVVITLKEKTSTATKPASNVISAGEIGKDVPDKARKEFERASKFSKEGKALEAIDHLKKAIALYPNFLMAHNDLGVQLLEQGDLDEAATELRRAIEIDEKAFNPYLNLGIVLIRQQRFAEAADTLRKALSLESDSPATKLYLGVALMNMNDLDGAERELKAAYDLGGTSYSIALFYLGELYLNKGERALARQALAAYLHEAPNAADAAQARKLIGMLQ